MNVYLAIGGLLVILVVGALVIIRPAITIDAEKAKAALSAFAARFKRSPK